MGTSSYSFEEPSTLEVSSFCMAARTDDIQGVADFLQKYPRHINAQDQFGTALISAFNYDREEIAQFLIDVGADVTIRSPEGKTPLELARARNWKVVVMTIEAITRMKTAISPEELAAEIHQGLPHDLPYKGPLKFKP